MDRAKTRGNNTVGNDDELTRFVPERVASKVAEVYGTIS
jgi:hypothetical protein